MYKLIIADDEPFVCHALEHKIQNMGLGIELLPSVCDGVSLVKSIQQHRPDIAIVDIQMPGLNGLESVELLKMQNLNFALIVSSAYSDYEYMQKALKLEAVDYLLKPCGSDALIEAIKKAVQKLDATKELHAKLQNEKKTSRSLFYMAGEKWLLSLLAEEPDRRSWQLLSEYCPSIRQGGYFLMWEFETACNPQLLDLDAVGDRILSYLRQYRTCVGVKSHGYFYTFFVSTKEEESEHSIRNLLEMIRTEIQKWFADITQICVGVSRLKVSEEQMTAGLHEARSAIMQQKKTDIRFFQYQESTDPPCSWKETAAKAAALLTRGETQSCISVVLSEFERLCSVLEEKYNAEFLMEHLKMAALSFVLELHHQITLLSVKSNFQNESGWFLYQNFAEIQTKAELLKWLEAQLLFCCRASACQKQDYNIHVEKTIAFIHEFYHKEISLCDAAQLLSITPAHLSRLLMKYRRATFTEILTGVRMHRAIELLKENKKSVKEICFEIGYPNISYFYRVFKKTTGFTVNSFRQSFV